MAAVRQRTTLGNRFRFLLRVLGLTGILVAVIGAGMALSSPHRPSELTIQTFRGMLAGGDPGDYLRKAMLILIGGVAVVVLWLAIEVLSGLVQSSGRKSLAGTANAVQIALAIALVIVVNAVGFDNYRKYDLTRDHEFTLASEQVAELQKLRTDAPTTIVVLQMHRTAGTLSDKSDAYDSAAERKIVEKVKDLVDQLREFGPQFHVAVLDTQDVGFERSLRELTKKRPGLVEAIRAAPENSIFFYADGKVRKEPRAVAEKLAVGTPRPAIAPDPDDSAASYVYPASVTRMSFTDFYQLDKTASREATTDEREGVAGLIGGPAYGPDVPGKGNLVLIPQGKAAFVRRVLALEERKPRVGLAVIHPYLTSREHIDEYSASGLRSALEANGFEVVDVILKRWGRGAGPSPAAYTFEESELDRIENRYNLFTLLAADRESVVKQLKKVLVRVESAPLPELDKLFGRQIGRPIRTEDDRDVLKRIFASNIQLREEELAEFTKQLAEVTPQYRNLMQDERASENRRITDIKAKLKQYVSECDVLIVPRLTTMDVTKGEIITPSLFHFSKDQAAVVKEFIAAGKPVLFALGPTNVGRGPGDTAGDDVEALLPRLGIELGRQTVITEKESQAMAERRDEALGSTVDVPPLLFDLAPTGEKAANPITAAFRTTARAVDRKLDLKRSGYRPVYVAPGFAEFKDRTSFAGEVMFTDRDSWNEDRPLPEDDYTPKYDPSKPDDPKKNTHNEERKGPFPVGVALQVPVPLEWLEKSAFPEQPKDASAQLPIAEQEQLTAFLPTFDGGLSAALLTAAAEKVKRPTVRIAVFGHGGLFTGKSLNPASETLLLHTLNWQLKRDDRLPQDVPEGEKWRFPRVELNDRGFALWRWGTFLGLPMLCGYAGLIVLMARKVR